MSLFRIPDPFTVDGYDVGVRWKKWKQKFLIYLRASSGSKEARSEKKKIDIFLNLVGDECLDVYNNISEENQSSLEDVLREFDRYFEPRRNLIYSGYQFLSRQQKEDESVDQYLTQLKTLINRCEFDNLSSKELIERLLTLKLVIGVYDEQTRQCLLARKELTIADAMDVCRGRECSIQQLKMMKNIENSSTSAKADEIDAVNYKNNQLKEKQVKCRRCNFAHPTKKCPAIGKTCTKCQKRNHFASVCKSVTEIVEEEADENEISDHIQVNEVKATEWNQKILVNGKYVLFKLDTGAQINVISYAVFKTLKNAPQLENTKKILTSYTGHNIETIGVSSLQITTRANVKPITAKFFIVKNENYKPILGLETCSQLNLIKRIAELSTEKLFDAYADVFDDSIMGCLPFKYDIKLKENCQPKISHVRIIPKALNEKVQMELERLVKHQIIERIEEPTDWVNPIVVIEKPNKSIRICIDPRALNAGIKREHIRMPTQETIFSQLAGAKFFSCLDASSAFLQVPLTDRSSKMCTIGTPFGRFRYKRLPFGITSASEVFQKAINKVLQGLEGVMAYIDDILVYGSTKEIHDARLTAVLNRAREFNLKLSREKSVFGKTSIRYLGHEISERGISIDESKLKAIKEYKSPGTRQELQRFLGMITYLMKFIPNLSEGTSQLRPLLSCKNEFLWDANHQRSFENLKNLMIKAPVLQFYNPSLKCTLSVDASQHGLGAVLLQNGLPICYASATLSETQQRYSQIEKEMLAIYHGCNKFDYYLYGIKFLVETDHKPILGLIKKPIGSLTPRLQRLIMKLTRYDFDLKHVPGKQMHISDALSRAPLDDKIHTNDLEGKTVKLYSVVALNETDIENYKIKTEEDEELKIIKSYIENKWPRCRNSCPNSVKDFFDHRYEISLQDDLLFLNDRLIIPKQKRKEVLSQLHYSHQGIVSCKKRARECVYWPRMSADIENMVKSCEQCQSYARSNMTEPMQLRPVPEHAWHSLGVDFLNLDKNDFLIIVDYFSKFVEVRKLTSKTGQSVISNLKQVFRTHGIPIRLYTDGGPPFQSENFKQFLKEYGMDHKISSPIYPQSNGMIERTIQTIRGLLTKAKQEGKDGNLSILQYNNCPKNNLSSPAKILMGRNLRCVVPVHVNKLTPLQHNDVKEQLLKIQEKTKEKYDKA